MRPARVPAREVRPARVSVALSFAASALPASPCMSFSESYAAVESFSPTPVNAAPRHAHTRRPVSRRANAAEAGREIEPIKSHLRTKPRAEESKYELIGCQSVRQWSSFLGLRTVVRA
jgi:hypothetical protein